jgi:hypothetical protein
LCPEQQAKIGWSRRGKAVVSKCLERKGMSRIFFCQGCGASGDLAKIQKHQQSSARKSSIRNFDVVRTQYPKPICQGKGILSLLGTKTKVVEGKLEKRKRQDDVFVAGNSIVDVAGVQNDDEFSDYDGECKSHDVCEYLRIVDPKHCVNSDTSVVPAQTAGQMIYLGRRPPVVSIILDLNAAEQTVYAFIVSSGICHKSAIKTNRNWHQDHIRKIIWHKKGVSFFD